MLKYPSVTWGTDPEAFFEYNGQIVGSEKFIPKEGVGGISNKIVRDGVQFEMHPGATNSVGRLGYSISSLFRVLRDIVDDNKNLKLNFQGLVEVSKGELDSLSSDTRILGCMPSHNFYGAKPILVDAATYRKRSSGGHIHIGLTGPIYPIEGKDQRVRLVPLLDTFVGAFSVLIDRDPGAAERRENYGRAGEYRLPKHGLEYRTISNYWLRSYTLMSFVFGMAAIAVTVLEETLNGKNLEGEVRELVDIYKVQAAINYNDFDLAFEVFTDLQPFLVKHLPADGFPLTPKTLSNFASFVKTAKVEGIERYFPTENIVRDWCNIKFESFDTFMKRI